MKRHCFLMPVLAVLSTMTAFSATYTTAQDVANSAPAADGIIRMDHIEVDRKLRQVRVDAESLAVEMPLEFVAVVSGGPEHESLFRTSAKPSMIHTGLLMLGLEPGSPLKYSDAAKRWVAPFGPPVRVSFEWTQDNITRREPVSRLIRSAKTKQLMPEQVFVFTGSVVDDQKRYLADIAGYVVSLVNFELTMIDVPRLASSANETLEWEFNADLGPPRGVRGWLIIEPAGKDAQIDTTSTTYGPKITVVKLSETGAILLEGQEIGSTKELVELLVKRRDAGPMDVRLVADPSGDANASLAVMQSLLQAGVPVKLGTATGLSDEALSEAELTELRAQWEKAVNPHAGAMRDAAATHYQVIAQLRERQQKLINESDRIQRLIEQLERDYADMTTPRPK